jgi:hypothetical protein
MNTGGLFAVLPGLVLLGAGAMAVLGLGLLLLRGAAGLAWGLAAQGGALVVALLALAAEGGRWEVFGLAVFVLAGRVVALPPLGGWLAQRLPAPPGPGAAIAVVGVVVAGVVLAAAGPVLRPGEALALAVFALGAVALAGRRDLAGQVAGVVGLESGLVLLVAASGAPAWLGVASAALPCAAGVAVLRRILAGRAGA